MSETEHLSAIAIEQATGRPSAPRRKLRWWHILLPLAVLILSPLVVDGVLSASVAIGHALGYSAAPVHLFSGSFARDNTTLQILMAISNFVMLAVMSQIARTRGAVPLTGYFAPIGARTVVLAAGSALLLLGIFLAVTNALQWSHLVAFHETNIEIILRAHSVSQLCGGLALAALLVPVAEEIYFRGLVLVWLRQSWGLKPSAAINAAFFALVHGYTIFDPSVQGWITTVGIACIALVNVAWTVRTGSLWPAIIVHATFNGVHILLTSAPDLWG